MQASPREQVRQGARSDGDQVVVVRSRYVRRRRLESSRPEMEKLKSVIYQPGIQLRTRGTRASKVEFRILYVETSAVGYGLRRAFEKIDFEPFDIDLQKIHGPVSDDRIEGSNWNSKHSAARRGCSACEIHIVAAKVGEDELTVRTADCCVMDLDRHSV